MRPGGPSQTARGHAATPVPVQSIHTATARVKVPVMQQAQEVLKLCPRTFHGPLGAPLQQAAGPGDDGQRDSAPQLLQKPHQRRVGHPPGAFPVHLQQDVSTPTKHKVEVGSKPGTHPDTVTFVPPRVGLQTPEDPEGKGKKTTKKG